MARLVNILILAEAAGDDSLEELKRLPKGANIVARTNNLEELKAQKEKLASVNVVLISHILGVSMNTFLSELWPLLPSLQWVYARSAGVDHMICPEMIRDRDKIAFTNARGVFSHSLAEYAMLAIGYFAKDLPRWERNKKEKKWDRYIVNDIRGSTLGIIGYGDIGRATAKLAKAYGMRVLALRRRPQLSDEDDLVDECFGQSDMSQLVKQCDYLVCAAPLTDSTRGMVGTEALSNVKQGCVLINVGRGAVVDEQALLNSLGPEGRLRGAALDVFTTEPLPADHPLWNCDNLLLSPHNADQTANFLRMAVAQFVDVSVPAFMAGAELPNKVDPTAGY